MKDYNSHRPLRHQPGQTVACLPQSPLGVAVFKGVGVSGITMTHLSDTWT